MAGKAVKLRRSGSHEATEDSIVALETRFTGGTERFRSESRGRSHQVLRSEPRGARSEGGRGIGTPLKTQI